MLEQRLTGGQLATAISNAVLRRVLSDWVVDVSSSGPLVVVKTPPGCAHVVASALDRGVIEGTLGTVAGDDTIFVVVEDTLTRAERELVRIGDQELVLRLRESLQRAMHESLDNDIERLTGRPVIGFMSTNNIDPDLAVEVFVLGPGATNGRTTSGDSAA